MALPTTYGAKRIRDIDEIADIVWRWKLFAVCPDCRKEAIVASTEGHTNAFIKCESCGFTKVVPISLNEVKRRVFVQVVESCK